MFADHYSPTELDNMDRSLTVTLPTDNENQLAATYESVKSRLQYDHMTDESCAVCELDHPRRELEIVGLDGTLLTDLQRCLRATPEMQLADFVVAQYDASTKDRQLAGLLLYPPAIFRETTGDDNSDPNGDCLTTTLRICKLCLSDLRKRKKSLPPRYSIANGNAIGRLPDEFLGLTRTEEQCIALVAHCVSMTTIIGGTRPNVLKSHSYFVNNTEGPIANMIPASLVGNARVTMVGAMTNAQKAKCKKMYGVRLDRTRAAMEFMCANHRVYVQNGVQVAALPADINDTIFIDRTDDSDQPVDRETQRRLADGDVSHNTVGSVYGVADEVLSNGDTTIIDRKTFIVPSGLPDSKDFIVILSDNYALTRRFGHIILATPTLFPGGSGGPNEPRCRQFSIGEWVRRCLRISGGRFGKHYGFSMLAFGYLSREAATRSLYYRLSVNADAVRAGRVTNQAVQQVLDLRRGIERGESATWGSNAERSRARHDIMGMMRRLGILHVFMTLSPDAAGTYTVGINSGDIDAATVTAMNKLLLPNRTERRQIAGRNPYECAKYYDRISRVFIEHVLGWDMKRGMPKRHRCILPPIRWWAQATESQLSGDLHGHYVISLYGFPATSTAFRTAIDTNPRFRADVVRCADQLTTVNPPLLQTADISCPTPTCLGELEAVHIVGEAYKRPLAEAGPVPTARCVQCDNQFCDKDVLDARIASHVGRHDLQIDLSDIEYAKCAPPSMPFYDDATSKAILTMIMRDVVMHWWTHCRSCFKKTKRTPKASVCRFFLPVEAQQDATFIDAACTINHQRAIGAEYFNGSSPLVMKLFGDNMDGRIVISTSTKHVVAYICKYTIKPQLVSEHNTILCLAAFAKASRKVGNDPRSEQQTDRERGVRILHSMLYSLTNSFEIAAPMCNLYLLRGSPFYQSHQTVRVNVAVLVREVNAALNGDASVSQEILVNDDGDRSRSTITPLQTYWHRPACLEHVHFALFQEQYHINRGHHDAMGLLEGHPQSQSHHVCPNATGKRKVMVLVGGDLPDIDRDNVIDDDIAFHHQAILALFKPSRQATDIAYVATDTASSAQIDQYVSFITGDHYPEAVADARSYVENCRDWYSNQRSAAENDRYESDEQAHLRAHPCQHEHGSQQGPDTCFFDVAPHIDDYDDDDWDELDDEIIIQQGEQRRADQLDDILRTSNLITVLDSVATTTPPPISAIPNLVVSRADYLDSVIDRSASLQNSNIDTSDLSNTGTTTFLQAFKDHRTRLQRLEECLHPVPFNPARLVAWTVPSELPTFCSIADVSSTYRLNFWQHVCFEKFARHVLYSWTRDIEGIANTQIVSEERERYALQPQLIGYLGGEAGAGKSAVIQALLTFATRWGRRNTIETLAYTGIAAIQVDGKTIHSGRNVQFAKFSARSPPSSEMRDAFSQVCLTIFDELSMIDQRLYGAADTISRTMSPQEWQHSPAGNKHVLNIGDWLQIPPVRGRPCFAPPDDATTQAGMTGYEAYRKVNFVVFLIENMRQRTDADYTAILRRMRWGALTDDDIAVVNSRVYDPVRNNLTTRTAHCLSPALWYQPFIVATNKTRCAINTTMTMQMARQHQRIVYEFDAEPANRRTKLDGLFTLDDDFTHRIPLRWQFTIGMPVAVSRRCPPLNRAEVIANGTVGFIVGFDRCTSSPDHTVHTVNGVTIHRLRRIPDMIYIQVRRCDRVLVEGFPAGVIGIPATNYTVQISLPNPNRNAKTWSVNVTAFNLITAYALTPEKVQGQTIRDGVVVAPLERHGGSMPPASLYVAFSRVESQSSLTLVAPLTRTYVDRFTPSLTTISEMRRLQDMVVVPETATPEQRFAFNSWLQQETAYAAQAAQSEGQPKSTKRRRIQ